MENSVYSGMKIVTEIILIPGGKETATKEEVKGTFWKAENYHQNYFLKMSTFPIANP